MFRSSGSVNSDCAVPGTARGSNDRHFVGGVGEQQTSPIGVREYIWMFVRFWGVLTAVVLGGVGVDLVYHKHCIGYYEIAAAIFVFLLEVLWVVTAFLRLFIRHDHRIWRWWSRILWIDGWKKSLLYGPLAAVPIVWPQKLWLSYVASGQLIFLSLAHFLMSLKSRRRKKRRGNLINGDIDSVESRFDEATDTITDGIPEPIPGSSISLADSLTGPDTILEI